MDIIIDVGRIYDPTRNKFDHHFKSFKDKYVENARTHMSSAGMIYKWFGKEIIQSMMQEISL